MTAKTLFTGKTHTTGGATGFARSADGHLEIDLPEPHPAAERLFAVAWSACFIAAVGVAAAQKKITLPTTPSIDAEVDLALANGEYFLRARLNVSVPGIDRDIAQELVERAHQICPYSKATRGNIEVEVTLA
jgi:Ohr subfamily peroxiredoxin